MVKLWLDDVRPAPEGWILCRWPEDVIEVLDEDSDIQVTHISLDHDLGDDDYGTGYDVLVWLEKHVYFNPLYVLPMITIHSANPVARQRMEAAITRIREIRYGR